MMTWIARVSFTKLLEHIKALKSSKIYKIRLENSYTFEEATTFLYASGFCNQVLLDLQRVLK